MVSKEVFYEFGKMLRILNLLNGGVIPDEIIQLG